MIEASPTFVDDAGWEALAVELGCVAPRGLHLALQVGPERLRPRRCATEQRPRPDVERETRRRRRGPALCQFRRWREAVGGGDLSKWQAARVISEALCRTERPRRVKAAVADKRSVRPRAGPRQYPATADDDACRGPGNSASSWPAEGNRRAHRVERTRAARPSRGSQEVAPAMLRRPGTAMKGADNGLAREKMFHAPAPLPPG